jgi:hypothetical protein
LLELSKTDADSGVRIAAERSLQKLGDRPADDTAVVAVLPLRDGSDGRDPELLRLGRELSEYLAARLAGAKVCQVVDREKLETALAELKKVGRSVYDGDAPQRSGARAFQDRQPAGLWLGEPARTGLHLDRQPHGGGHLAAGAGRFGDGHRVSGRSRSTQGGVGRTAPGRLSMIVVLALCGLAQAELTQLHIGQSEGDALAVLERQGAVVHRLGASDPQALRRALVDGQLLELWNRWALTPKTKEGGLDPRAFERIAIAERGRDRWVLTFSRGGLTSALGRYRVPVDPSADPPGGWSPRRLDPLRRALQALKTLCPGGGATRWIWQPDRVAIPGGRWRGAGPLSTWRRRAFGLARRRLSSEAHGLRSADLGDPPDVGWSPSSSP